MLKKISQIFLVLLLLVSTMGMTVSMHYCDTNLESVSVFSAPESCCEIPSGCCHDESITIKVEDNFSATSYSFDFSQWGVELPALIELCQVDIPVNNSDFTYYNLLPERKIQTVLSRIQSYLL